MDSLRETQQEIKSGKHKKFFLDTNRKQVSCRCGERAVFINGGYICSTITAYPCKYNRS